MLNRSKIRKRALRVAYLNVVAFTRLDAATALEVGCIRGTCPNYLSHIR